MAGSLHSTLLELYQVGLRCQVSTPWTHKPFIYKRRLIPQAGRRRWAAGKSRLTGGNSENLYPLALFPSSSAVGAAPSDRFCWILRIPSLFPSCSAVGAATFKGGGFTAF